MTSSFAATVRSSGSFLGSIRSRLLLGFGTLVLLLGIAVFFGRRSMLEMASIIRGTLTDVQAEGRLSSELSTSVLQQLDAAALYLETADSMAARDFRRHGWTAHRVQRGMNALGGQRSDEVALVASIGSTLSRIEVHYALAHRLADLGRARQASLEGALARGLSDSLFTSINRLSRIKGQKVADAATRLSDDASDRSWLLVALMVAALVAGALTVLWIVGSLSDHLAVLVRHARQLSEGDLTVRNNAPMPGEFQVLADALNHTGESLSTIVSVVARTSDDVATSAHDLATVAEQISLSAGQMATAMADVTTGAETQASQLRGVDQALQVIRERTAGVRTGADEVSDLAAAIEASADAKRSEIERALSILTDVRTTVREAATEVTALNDTAADINKFVGVVSRIADQTNLLALNAAIEAARAGQAGRGFAVVAEEVRKLAEQAQAAADDIVQLTGIVTQRVANTSKAMELGVTRVGEIEHVSREIDDALTTIASAAERTRRAAASVTEVAEENVAIAASAATDIVAVAKTAEGHAATAQEVSAATEEQSAACEQMNASSNQLMDGSGLLRELIKGLKTAPAS
ncbi:MAG TPA: methyl-accepting chemotaxis protein [Gemmatimonadaceae bacterium]|nr:methyl-accepting chemotaxis protein [Gemmatimonadaceae bacterium]